MGRAPFRPTLFLQLSKATFFRDVSLVFPLIWGQCFVFVEDSGTLDGSSWWYRFPETSEHTTWVHPLPAWRRENWTTLKQTVLTVETPAGQTCVLHLFSLLSSFIFCSIKLMSTDHLSTQFLFAVITWLLLLLFFRARFPQVLEILERIWGKKTRTWKKFENRCWKSLNLYILCNIFLKLKVSKYSTFRFLNLNVVRSLNLKELSLKKTLRGPWMWCLRWCGNPVCSVYIYFYKYIEIVIHSFNL